MEGLPGASVFSYSSSTPFTDVCCVHISWVHRCLQIVKIWGWTSKRNIWRFLTADYATIFRSYNCFTRETEREKNENNIEGKKLLRTSPFLCLPSGFCWVEKRRETDAYARFAGAYQRLLSNAFGGWGSIHSRAFREGKFTCLRRLDRVFSCARE